MLTAAQCRMARAALAWGMKDLAARSKVSANTIDRFENGRATPISCDAGRVTTSIRSGGYRVHQRRRARREATLAEALSCATLAVYRASEPRGGRSRRPFLSPSDPPRPAVVPALRGCGAQKKLTPGRRSTGVSSGSVLADNLGLLRLLRPLLLRASSVLLDEEDEAIRCASK